MAQIVTITNPLTGQPAQVDQLEHTAQQIDDAIDRALPSTDHPGCYYRMVDGVVEWFNPPMQLGVEYRTTERYNGKPVYAMAVNFGNLPSAGTKTVDIFPDFAAEYILDVKGVTVNSVFPFSSTDGDFGSISLFLSKYGGCRVTTTTTYWGNTTATIVAKYTKPTD